jgi:diketogulonate reductase-like aldo/keto reductase
MGENAAQRQQEVAALRAGIDHGLTVIDTAEMYADGGAEEVVARRSAACAIGWCWCPKSIRGMPAGGDAPRL